MIGIGNITNAQKSLGILDTQSKIVDARAMTGASLSRIDHEISELDSSYVQKEKISSVSKIWMWPGQLLNWPKQNQNNPRYYD